MPKLNVQQNNQNVIQAFKNALAIGRLKGIIASDGNHNFSTSGTNDNLLDNAYFVGGGSQLGYGIFPINQRGQTQYTGGGVQLDRWHGWAGTDTLVLTANGLQYTSPSSNGIFQYFPVFPTTETVTFSAKIGGTIYSVTLPEGQNQVRLDQPTFGLTVDRNDKAVGISSYNSTLLLQAAKLEVGTVSTLANDVPPDFGEELAKCLRYLWVYKVGANTPIGSGTTFGTSSAIDIVTPVPMRAGNVTASFNVTPYIVYDGGLGICDAGAAIITNNGTGNHLRWQIGHSGTNIQGHSLVILLAGNETTFTFSNEL